MKKMLLSGIVISILVLLISSPVSSQARTMNKQYKVLISNPIIDRDWLKLLDEKCEIIIVDNNSRENILEKVPGVDAIFWSTKHQLDKEIIEAAGENLKVVATMSAGYNHIDTAELKKRKIHFGNTPKVLNDAVANTAILLALGASRRLHEARLSIERGEWGPHVNHSYMMGQDIQGSTVGIIGLGGIGQTIAKRLQAFDVKSILYTGHREKEEGKKLGAKFVNLDTLVKDSDFIIVSAPLTNETRGMCNESFFSKMKNTAVFVNIARGAIVVQDDLIKALKEKRIFAAGLDVMVPEPLPTDSELLQLPNVVLLPHIGSATTKTRRAMAELACENILRGLDNKELLSPVL